MNKEIYALYVVLNDDGDLDEGIAGVFDSYEIALAAEREVDKRFDTYNTKLQIFKLNQLEYFYTELNGFLDAKTKP